MVGFNQNETWNRIKQLTVTSKHYTPRDKNEMIAQEPTFSALDDIITISAALNVTDPAQASKKARLDHLVINALNQLKLYYLVGTEGMGTAINTTNHIREPEAKLSIKYIKNCLWEETVREASLQKELRNHPNLQSTSNLIYTSQHMLTQQIIITTL